MLKSVPFGCNSSCWAETSNPGVIFELRTFKQLNYATVESNLQQLIKLVLDPISWSSSIHLKWFKFQSSLHSLRTTSRDQKIEKHH